MLSVSADQKLIDIVRLALESADADICITDDELQGEYRLKGKYLIDLFACGFPAELTLKALTKVSPPLMSGTGMPGHKMFDIGKHWFISVFDSLHDGILIADQNEIVRYINKSFERISGAKFSGIVGKILSEARPGARLGGVIRSGTPLFGVRRKFGDTEYITDMHPFIIDGVCMGGITVARDITEIQHLQTKLSKYRLRYNDLLRQINKENAARYTFSNICGTSSALRGVKQLAEKLASSNLHVLLRGASGTGKELFAHAIHLSSPRKNQPFVTVNCAAIPGQLLESELFGYSEGAFSGAKQSGKPGLITLAHNGTLFLDEIGDMDVELQAKILRVLQTGEVQPLGNITKSEVDVRIISATNKDLEAMIETGKFREDLFYRLNVSQLHIPPLRERVEDIASLAQYFLSFCIHPSLGQLELDPQTIAILEQYSWPGNVRELENTIRFIANITDQQRITPDYLPQVFFHQKIKNKINRLSQTRSNADELISLKDGKATTEKELIVAALNTFGRSVKDKRKAADHLGISLTTLYARMSIFDIK
ncbi:MAG: sigma 54-interacting transcriptional regulator [Negativicutes bacterium]|nr:sigma 54-interacting transcriptional regulator [Negativicutes bacterium]